MTMIMILPNKEKMVYLVPRKSKMSYKVIAFQTVYNSLESNLNSWTCTLF